MFYINFVKLLCKNPKYAFDYPFIITNVQNIYNRIGREEYNICLTCIISLNITLLDKKIQRTEPITFADDVIILGRIRPGPVTLLNT